MPKEFVVKYKSGVYDWIDPVDSVEEIENGISVVTSSGEHWSFFYSELDNYVLRDLDVSDPFPFDRNSS